MTLPTGGGLASDGRTPMKIPVVTAEVADGAVTPLDMAYIVDELQKTCGQNAARVRRARARLFGPDPSGVTFAEVTLVLTDGWTLSEGGRGSTPRRAVDALCARVASQLASHPSCRDTYRHGSV